MNGLDYIKKYSDGGDVVNTEPEETSQAPLAIGKAVTSKGPYALPTPTGGGAVDEGILQRMQQMIAEREARKGGFAEGMLDAQAWWSGGEAGPYRALMQRRAQKEADEATTFGMRRDIAQYRAAQEQAQRDRQRFLGDETQPTGAQPGGAQPAGMQPGGAQMGQGGNALLNLVEDPGLRQQIRAQYLTPGGQQKAMAQLNSYLAKRAEEPQIAKTVRYLVDNNFIDKNQLAPGVLVAAFGPSAFVPHATFGVGGEGRQTPIAAASSMVGRQPVVPAPGVARQPMPSVPGMTPPTPAAPTAAPQMPTPQAAPRAPVAAAPRAPAAPAAPVPSVEGAQDVPLISPALRTGFEPGSVSDVRAREKAAEKEIEMRAETTKPIRQELGASIVATRRAASAAPDSIREYDMVESLLKKHPEAVGIAQDGSATAAMIQLAKPGVTIPILGTFKVEGMEEAVAQKKLSPEAIAARNTFNSFAKRKSVDFAQNNLTGEGRGTLSNADLIMSDVAKGLSKDSPAATNLVFTILNRENDQMMLERGRLIEKLETDARRAGVPPNYEALRSSPEWKKTMADKDERIKRRFPEIFNSPEGKKRYAELEKSGGAPSSAVKKYNPKTGKVE